MKVLAIETATMLGGVAVMDGERLLAESTLNVRTTHSERLMPTLELTLERSGLSLDELDALAVSAGPGSFTGLRIGLGTAKGIAYATGGLPIVAVPTLEAFAWSFPHCAHPVCTLLDARKNELYAALFKWEEGSFRRIFKETPVSVNELIERVLLKEGLGRIVLAGQGAELYREELQKALGENAVFAPAHLMAPSAANVAFLGQARARAGEFEDPAALSPMYIRKSEAELKADAGA